MSVLTQGIRSSYPVTTPPPSGELVAATPLGRDAEGKNLVAYIVRTDDEAPPLPVPRGGSANANDPRARLQDATQKKQDRSRTDVPARFIKPDHLLSREQKAEVDHLRDRDDVIRSEADELASQDGESLLTSFVYATGPDGKRYVLGVGAPLRAYSQTDEERQRRQKKSEAEAQADTSSEPQNVHIKAALAYRSTAYNDAQGARAGLLDSSL